MLKKSEKGITAIDIVISIIIITIFISLIGNLLVSININSENIERKTIATAYAVQEIEKIKSNGINPYLGEGIIESSVDEEDIYKEVENEEKVFTGFHKKITIEDYVYLKDDETKTSDLVKKATVEISYKVKSKDKNVTISTYISKE